MKIFIFFQDMGKKNKSETSESEEDEVEEDFEE